MLSDADTFYGRVGDGLRSLAEGNRDPEGRDVYHYSVWVADSKCGVGWSAITKENDLHNVTLGHLPELQ